MQRIIYNRRKRIIYISGKRKKKKDKKEKEKKNTKKIPKSSGSVRWQIIIGCVDEPKAKRFEWIERIGYSRRG